MSTRKLRDGTTNKTITTTTKARKAATTTKKEVPKTRSTTKMQVKRNEDEKEEDKKIKKATLKPTSQSSSRLAGRPALTKKTGSTTKTASNRAVTPPSNRVIKSQFFPSKKMYANALQSDNGKKPRELPLQTVEKSKIVREVSPDTSSVSERPRTATLRKGSIVNKNIVGPDVPKKIKVASKVLEPPIIKTSPDLTKKTKAEESPIEYEDDFDSYESDFEAYQSSDSTSSGTTPSETSESSESESADFKATPKRVGSAGTDDEKKLDSGTYELPDARHKQILDNIKESIEKENANLNHDQNRSNLGSLSDEGFEEGKSLQFINFLGAQKKYQHRKSVELRRKRGEEILSMIRLDHYSFTLFDLAPVPYDVFIKNFGKSNTVQTSVQTGEDDLNEEVQTDEIIYKNKWTQCPPSICKIDDEQNFWEIYKCNVLGVGGDTEDQHAKDEQLKDTGLEKFLLTAGNLMLDLFNEESTRITAQNNNSNIPFSKGCIVYNTQTQSILKGRPINNLCFSSDNCNKFLTVHGRRREDIVEKNYICIWNTSDTEAPEMFLVIFGEVTSCVYSLDCSTLIFGGSRNGTINVWDISENSMCHQNVCEEKFNDLLIRGPTYSTEINYGHCCKVISVQSLTSTSSKEMSFFAPHKATEVCSLDEDGLVIVWSVIYKEENQGRTVEKQGLAHWGSVIITINTKISLKLLYPEIVDFRCTDMCLSHFDSNNIYISTNYGIIVHCLSSGGKSNVKKYYPDTQTQANCLEMCPFSSRYFLGGFDNGDINFYSHIFEKPLMVLSNKDTVEGKSKIEIIQWSHNRPLTLYTKDVTNTIHVWNLKVNDMFPIYSVPFKEKILCMRLSPVIRNNDGVPEKTYMAIAADNGFVYVHLLGETDDQQTVEELEKDKRKFLNYINRCG